MDMTPIDPAALAYLARRDVSGQWRGFLRAMIETLDLHIDRAARNGLLRAVGARMGAAQPLPPSATLAELEGRMNAVLAELSWGYVALALDEPDRSLRLTHSAAPAVAMPADAKGEWFAQVLEGLYSAWLAAQQGGQGEATPLLRVARVEPGQVVLRYGA